jgi:two-component system CheB/CheR fusion protein
MSDYAISRKLVAFQRHLEQLGKRDGSVELARDDVTTLIEELIATNRELDSLNRRLEEKNETLDRLNNDLQHLNTDLQQLIENVDVAVLFLDGDLRVIRFTPAITHIFPLRQSDRGRRLTDLTSKLRGVDLVADLNAVRIGGDIEREVIAEKEGASHAILMRIRRYRMADSVLGIVLSFFDINAILVAAHAETARYAALSRASGDAILGLSLDGAVNAWSRGAERLLGYTAEEMIGKHISVLAPEGFETEQCSLLEQVQSGKEVLPYDTVRRHKDGTLVPVSIRAAPILTAEETPIGVSETMRDITDRKQAEERTALLTQELAHRTKNLLSLVHAVMLQTANHSSNKDSFIRSVDERLRAMAQAQDLLIANTLKGALVSDLVRSCLKPFIVNEASLEMHGPPVFLKADVVHNLSLVLHELASNALKYGALTQAHGRVFVIWELDGAEVISRRFRISWREVDGPPVIPPQRRGFGTEVINEVPKYELGAEITLDYAPTGLQWRLDMPADRCVDVGQ